MRFLKDYSKNISLRTFLNPFQSQKDLAFKSKLHFNFQISKWLRKKFQMTRKILLVHFFFRVVIFRKFHPNRYLYIPIYLAVQPFFFVRFLFLPSEEITKITSKKETYKRMNIEWVGDSEFICFLAHKLFNILVDFFSWFWGFAKSIGINEFISCWNFYSKVSFSINLVECVAYFLNLLGFPIGTIKSYVTNSHYRAFLLRKKVCSIE